MNETLAFLDAVKQGHHDDNQQYDDSKGDSKDQNKILVDILYASIVAGEEPKSWNIAASHLRDWSPDCPGPGARAGGPGPGIRPVMWGAG